jgi:HEAT repeat protein
MSTEKMLHWSDKLLFAKELYARWSLMESARENLVKLMNILANPIDSATSERVRAAERIQGMLDENSDPELAEELLECIRNESDPAILVRLIPALQEMKSLAVPILTDILLAIGVAIYESPGSKAFQETDESNRLRCAAARALGVIGDKRSVVALMGILNNRDENYRLRLTVAESLGRVGDEFVVKPLIDLFSDEREKSVYLKESVARALGMLGDIRAIEPLIDMLEAKRDIRDKFNFLKERIIEAVAQIGRPTRKTTHGLILALKDEAPTIRLAAIEALGTLGDEACLPEIQECILDSDDDVACAAVNAAYRLGGEGAIRDLLTLENLPQFLRDELEGYIP